jgi:hypothetical protein
MKARARSSRGRHPRRRTSPPRSKRIVLRSGQRLVTSTVIIVARRAGGGGAGITTTVTCECTKAEPNKPDCQPTITTTPGGGTVNVTCTKSGGCKTCKQTTTTSGVFIA